MSGRITPAMITGSTLNDLNAALAAMQRSSNELSSGRSILAPSDNPYGASHAIDLQSQLDGLTSYANSVQDGISWETTSSSAMANINTIAQRVRELLVQAANGTYSQNDLATMGLEVEQLTEGVKQDANTQFAGQYLFGGTLTTTAPYQQGAVNDEYQGDAGTVARAIGPGATVTVSSQLSTVLGNGQASGDGKLLDTLRTIVTHLREGTPEAKQALASTDMKNLDANLETLAGLQAAAGSVTNQLQTAAARIEELAGTITKSLSNTQDADLAKTTIAYSNEQAAYQAALRAGASIVQETLLNFLR
jgi:flagellar hook-associated protein 3 FlgL